MIETSAAERQRRSLPTTEQADLEAHLCTPVTARAVTSMAGMTPQASANATREAVRPLLPHDPAPAVRAKKMHPKPSATSSRKSRCETLHWTVSTDEPKGSVVFCCRRNDGGHHSGGINPSLHHW